MPSHSAIKAIYRKGDQPLEPLPATWKDGEQLHVEPKEAPTMADEELDRGFQALEALCAANDPDDDERFTRALEDR